MTRGIEVAIEAAIQRANADAWNCIAVVLADRALEQARTLDREMAGGRSAPPLAGMPFVVKSLFDVKGEPTLAGGPPDPSIAVAAADSALVRQLSEAGAIPIGIAHMDEYAYGFLGDNAHHGRVINPRDSSTVTGGSSSGSAAAVASGIVPFAIGSDTNGSIRVPAALCGVYGLKPSYDHLSLVGSRALAQSLDHAGLLGSSLSGLEAVWRVLAKTEASTPDVGTGVSVAFASGDYERLAERGVREAMHALRAQWPQAPIIEFNHVEESFAAASLVTAFEASRNHRETREQSPYRYSAAIASRLDSAAHVSPTDYALAKAYQDLLTQQLADLFAARRIDVLVAPCTPVKTLGVGEESVMLANTMVKASDAAGLFTRPFSLAGYPVLLLPAEATDPQGCALQLIGRPGDEHVLFSFAREVVQRPG